MLVAFVIVHDGDPFSQKEKSLMYLIAFITLYFTGPGKYSLGYKE
jgi:putative oxidoreductase